jgi:adenylate cyclase
MARDLALKSLFTAAGAYLLLALLYITPATRAWLDALEVQAISLRFQLRGERQPSTDIKVFGITEEVLAAFEAHGVYYPFPRTWHALALRRLADAGARIVVLDILFSEAGSWDESEDAALRDAINYCHGRGCEVVLAAAIEQREYAPGVRSETLVLPAPVIMEARPVLGLANTHTKLSNKLYEYTSRALPLGEAGAAQAYYTQASQAALLYWQQQGVSEAAATARLAGDGAAYRINYLGPPAHYPEIYYDYITLFPELQLGAEGAARALTAEEQARLKALADGAVVFIGSRAKADNDYFETPYGQMFGVDTIAQAFDTRAAGLAIQTLPPPLLLALAALLGLLAWASALLRPFWRTIVLAALAAGILLLIEQQCFNLARLELYAPVVIGGFALVFGTCAAYGGIAEESARHQLRLTFNRYVSPEIVAQIIADPSLAGLHGVERNVAVMFNDIRSYSTLTEDMSPPQIVELLNAYLGEVTDIIRANRGAVDKYLGDGLMAFFGAPVPTADPAGDAIQAALEMVQALHARVNPRLEALGLPQLKVGIGIHYGAAVAGNIGSEQRMNYTLIGDAVNVASRVEGLTKELDWAVVVTRETKDAAVRQFSYAPAGERLVKGRSHPVELYRVLPAEGVEAFRLSAPSQSSGG